MNRPCLACGGLPAITREEYPALCVYCLQRSGEPVTPGQRIICTEDEGCSGVVDRMEDDLVVVALPDGRFAWLPVENVVAVQT